MLVARAWSESPPDPGSQDHLLVTVVMWPLVKERSRILGSGLLAGKSVRMPGMFGKMNCFDCLHYTSLLAWVLLLQMLFSLVMDNSADHIVRWALNSLAIRAFI